MQAMRFLADYCNNDVYYGARYEDQNFVRAGNQIQLLKILIDKTEILQKIVSEELKHTNSIVNGNGLWICWRYSHCSHNNQFEKFLYQIVMARSQVCPPSID